MTETLQNQKQKKYLAYVRVSSKDQARGTSLEEQKSYIRNYAQHKDISIIDFYGEVESASKTGREIFQDMINRLRKESLQGIIFHKVDRSARNPRDQALLYDLMNEDYILHFVSEGLSTDNPVGRNMMYIMWGMASGYSENLRAEINKGLLGRLKQGKIPGPAPIGYIKAEDCTSIHDPEKAVLVKRLFKDYSTGRYSVEAMVQRSKEIGLTNKGGRKLDKNSVHRILRETFYYGLISRKTGVFEGVHEPLISKELFDKVQYLLKAKGFKIEHHFKYSFQGLLSCPSCEKPLKSMTAKGRWKYYLCRHCKNGVIREDHIEDQWIKELNKIKFTNEDSKSFRLAIENYWKVEHTDKREEIKALELELSNIKTRLDALLQKYIDQKVDDDSYSQMRQVLLNRQIQIKEIIANKDQVKNQIDKKLDEIGKLLISPEIAYMQADPVNRRRLIKSMVANLSINQKLLTVNWKKEFQVVANRPRSNIGGDGGS